MLNDVELGPVADTYIEILDEAGFLPTGGFGVVDLNQIPRGRVARKQKRLCARTAPRSAAPVVLKILLDQARRP